MDTEYENKVPEAEPIPVGDGGQGPAPEEEKEPPLTDGEEMTIVRIGVRPGFMLRKVGQAYMVMPTGPRMKEYEGMITLNETGAFLFKESQKPDVSKEKLIAACIEEYGATEEEAKQSVDMFVLQCGQCGLFETRKVTVRVKAKNEGASDEPKS
ncbi:MAG: PqqD family protein [Clostridia bacterium]|nr:PqqD family protein [Clostridia bacterium]